MDTPGSAATWPTKASPLTSKFLYWSKLAQAGDSRTAAGPPPSLSASAAASRTARSSVVGAKRLLLLGCGTALALAAVLYGAVFGFTDTFVALFNSESSALMAEYAHSGMRIYFLGYFFAGCNIVAAGYLGAVNRPTEATITSVSRGVAAIVTCSLILSALFGMNGVWSAFPAAEAITLALMVFLLKRSQSVCG